MMTTNESAAASLEERIAVRAYELWIERGSPISDGKDDWFAAQQQIQSAMHAELSRAEAGVKRKAKVARKEATGKRSRAKAESQRAAL